MLKQVNPSRARALLLFLALVSMTQVFGLRRDSDSIEQIRRGFENPPDDARIMMRWWWFGPAVEKPELERELRAMKAADIGGVEIQPVYPLELDDLQTGFRNTPYLSDAFLDSLKFAAATARQLGMRVDLTLGSGWPYGGPHTPVTEAAGRLRIERVVVADSANSVPVPAIENGEKLIAVFLTESGGRDQQLKEVRNDRVAFPPALSGSHTVLFFISSRTGQQVKRASVGAEGFVLDHYERAAIEHHLSTVGDCLMKAFVDDPPYAVFSDSLEVVGSDWTNNFLEEFRKRRGYDLTPHLPALIGDTGEDASAIRHDWGKTLTELAEEHYLTPIREWAHAHRTRFRSQTYGEPPVVLSSNALVDLPEGEMGPRWRQFSPARWASSASHLYGRLITSSETWTWLHAPSFRATPLDMKAEADLHFIEGINQLIGHGWPYSPPSAGEPGWRFYAAAAFNDHNPWFQVMPEIARYMQRVSYLMRQGRPANDVAIYLPTDDAWAQFAPRSTSVSERMDALLGPTLIPQVLNAGFNFDFIDDKAIEAAGVPYRVLILPGIERMPLVTFQKLSAYVKRGGLLIATRRRPSLAPGLIEAKTDTSRIREIAHELFDTPQDRARFIPDEQTVGSAIARMVTPDFATSANAASFVGFVHRKLASGDVYFVVNTSNQPVDTEATVRASGPRAESWDPFTGAANPVNTRANSGTNRVALHLAPYESRIFVFFTGPLANARGSANYLPSHDRQGVDATNSGEPDQRSTSVDISSEWKVKFLGLNRIIQMPRLWSWTDNDETRFYSGEAVYEKVADIPPEFLRAGKKISIDFGPGEPVSSSVRHEQGMRALLESPVRESAFVYVNGKQAGAIWHPPYEVDVTGLLHGGSNHLTIRVANLAINEMAGHALPDYRLLNLRYGKRFVPQGFENLKPLPAGILGPIHLVAR
ncbi:MAG: glycosyl hydrolase [Bryobacteraceae bacterium]